MMDTVKSKSVKRRKNTRKPGRIISKTIKKTPRLDLSDIVLTEPVVLTPDIKEVTTTDPMLAIKLSTIPSNTPIKITNKSTKKEVSMNLEKIHPINISKDPYILLRQLIEIDPAKLTNRHCYYTDTGKDPYEFSDEMTMDEIKKEPRHPSGFYKNPDVATHPLYNNVHLGQRKLMLSEIQVLMKYYEMYPDIHPVMLYIGSAPGIHLVTLSKMFPHVKFILYDGAAIYPPLHKMANFEVHDKTTPLDPLDKKDKDSLNDGFFTTKKCKRIAKRIKSDNLIFVSDIRLTEEEFEEGVLRDLRLQETWMYLMTPKISLVKFRVPYSGKDLTYLPGDILYGIWPPMLSTETRLLVTQKDIIDKKSVNYSLSDYEGILYYHNKYKRTTCQSKIPKLFAPYITSKNNIYCSCYDCQAELHVLYKYSVMFEKPLNETVHIFGIGLNHSHKVEFPRASVNKRKIINEIYFNKKSI